MWGIEFRMLKGVDLPNLAGDLFCYAEAVAVSTVTSEHGDMDVLGITTLKEIRKLP
jgi:hypothetical protein